MINDTVIDQKPEMTPLGFTLDDQLSFSSHVSNVCRKAPIGEERIGILLSLRNLIPTPAKLHIVKFAVIPHLTYCQTVWHFCCSSDARKLERFKNEHYALYTVTTNRRTRNSCRERNCTNTSEAAATGHCNLNVQSKKWRGASLYCGLICRYH